MYRLRAEEVGLEQPHQMEKLIGIEIWEGTLAIGK